MVFETAGTAEAFLLGRVFFGGVLAFMALGNLLEFSWTLGYAQNKGVPAVKTLVPLGSLLLLAGSVSVLLGVFPLIGAAAIVLFMLAVNPVMHDFWNEEGMDQKNEQFHFLKNTALAGGALVLLGLAGLQWPYALNIGL